VAILQPGLKKGDCFNVWVWHDSEFPASTPTLYHYCGSDQLRAMADFADEKAGE